MAVAVDDRRVRVESSSVHACERDLASLVDALEPDDIALAHAADVWSGFDRIERLAASAKTLLARRVAQAGAWKHSGARSAAEHLAKLSGTTTSSARRTLQTSQQLETLPALGNAMRAGELSAVQAGAVAEAASVDPGSERRLVALAQATNVNELREECLRTKVAADIDREATHRRIHEQRRVRTFADAEGAWNLVARGTAERGARFEAALEPKVDEMFARARSEGRREPRETYVFDALMELIEREPAGAPPRRAKPRYLALLHVDVEALTRGVTETDERCEIVGVGPVPVRVARELLGESILHLVVTKGIDVANVVHLGRGPTAAQRIALLWAKPKCANVQCSSMFVQIDHRVPWSRTRHTRLDELDPLCPHDHKLKTTQGWSLVDGRGRRAFVPPSDPRHPRHKPPP